MTTPEKPRTSIDDPDAPPSEEELREAEALRAALEHPEGAGHANDDADFARSLALSHAPRDLSPDEHRAIVERALSDMKSVKDAKPAPPAKRGGVVRVAFGAAAAALSLAAAFALFMGTQNDSAPATAPAAMAMNEPVPQPVTHAARTRSTQGLFQEPFQAAGGTSARIDRIAMARASDLRDNRFARWGVR